MVAQFCESEHRKWDAQLPDLVFAMNTSKHDSTGFSPAFLNFGRELDPPKMLYHTQDESEANVDGELDTASLTRHNARLAKLREVYELVKVNLGRAFSTQSRHYNLRRREWRCHLGDQVYKRENPLSVAAKGFAAKLAPKYSGPYTVIKVNSPVVYDIRNQSGKIFRHVHIKDLKSAHVSTGPSGSI